MLVLISLIFVCKAEGNKKMFKVFVIFLVVNVVGGLEPSPLCMEVAKTQLCLTYFPKDLPDCMRNYRPHYNKVISCLLWE